jgi:vacuolar protein sorting-associated protein 45
MFESIILSILILIDQMNVVSMVFSQSEATTKEVFLFRSIVPRKGTLTDERGKLLDEELDEADQLKAVSHLKAVCLLRPTAENITLLERHLEKPRFASYHICASSNTARPISVSCRHLIHAV